MTISNIVLSSNSLSRNGTFDASTQQAPYNTLYHNLGSQSLRGGKVALQKCILYRSWASIRADNNTFSFSFPTGASTYTNISVVVPVGLNFETVQEMDNYMKTWFISNKMYLINSTTGEYLYWMTFVENPTAYGVSLIQTLVPTSLPSGYTTPSGFVGFPSVSRTMKFTTDASKFNLLIGYPASTSFNGNTAATTFESSFSPQFNPVSSFRITLNIANNPLSLNGDSSIIYSDSASGVDWGSKVSVEPNNLVWYDISSGSNQLILSFTDQNGEPLQIKDPSIDVLLLIDI